MHGPLYLEILFVGIYEHLSLERKFIKIESMDAYYNVFYHRKQLHFLNASAKILQCYKYVMTYYTTFINDV